MARDRRATVRKLEPGELDEWRGHSAVVHWLEREYAAAKKRADDSHDRFLKLQNEYDIGEDKVDAAYERHEADVVKFQTIYTLLRKAKREAAK